MHFAHIYQFELCHSGEQNRPPDGGFASSLRTSVPRPLGYPDLHNPKYAIECTSRCVKNFLVAMPDLRVQRVVHLITPLSGVALFTIRALPLVPLVNEATLHDYVKPKRKYVC